MATTRTKPQAVKWAPYVIDLPDGRQAFARLAEQYLASTRGAEVKLNEEGQQLIEHVRTLSMEVPSEPTAAELRAFRKALGLTQAEFAQKLAYSTISVKKWEAGDVQPNSKAITRLRRLVSSATRRGTIVPTK